jgi:hypothetical protein
MQIPTHLDSPLAYGDKFLTVEFSYSNIKAVPIYDIKVYFIYFQRVQRFGTLMYFTNL